MQRHFRYYIEDCMTQKSNGSTIKPSELWDSLCGFKYRRSLLLLLVLLLNFLFSGLLAGTGTDVQQLGELH